MKRRISTNEPRSEAVIEAPRRPSVTGPRTAGREFTKTTLLGLGVFLIICLKCLVAQSGIMIEDKYDRFEDKTVIGTDLGSFLSEIQDCRTQPRIVLAMTFNGHTIPETKPDILIMFFSESKDWKYLRYHNVYALADGKPIKMGDSIQNGYVKTGYVTEQISVFVPYSEFKKFYKASEIEFKIGITEFIPSQKEIDHINEFIEYCEGRE